MDKLLHLAVGLSLGLTGTFTEPALGIGLALTAGAAKELRDLITRRGTPDLADFAATAAGGLLGGAVSLAIHF